MDISTALVGWRVERGNEPIARIVGHVALRAFTWFAAWHVAARIGTGVVVVLLLAAVSLSLWFRRTRGRRARP